MALSNTTHGATGKAHGLTGKHGDKHAASATGLEFLTGETITTGDATDAQPKQGVSFASLVQTIARTVLPAARKADAAIDSDADTPTHEPQGNTDKPDNPAALLALALQGEKHADPAKPTEASADEVSEANAAKPPHEGWHLGKRIHELKQRILVENAANAPATTATTPTPAQAADTAEPVADTAPSDTVAADQPDQSVSMNLAAQQPLATVSAPIVSKGKSPEPAISGKLAERADGKRDLPTSDGKPAALAESKTAPSPVTEAFTMIEEAAFKESNKKSEINSVNIQKLNNNPEIKSDRPPQDSGQIVAALKPGLRPATDTRTTGDSSLGSDGKEVQATKSEVAPIARADAHVREVQQSQPQPQFTAPAQPATITTNLTGALNSQVVDMGVSGQWIDDIARQIASIGANPGHGSFRIESQALGGVRVDIAPSVHGAGSDVLMRVDNDAAFAALDKDRDRLVQDARMASVRIGELRIDRLAPAQDAQGSGSSTSQQQGNSASQQGNQQSMNQANTQTGGQMDNRGGNQPGRQDAAAMSSQHDGQNSPKTPFTNAVMNSAERDDVARSTRSDRSDTARYA